MNMNSTDIADQLWGVTDRIIGCGTENGGGHISYGRLELQMSMSTNLRYTLYDKQKKEKRPGLPPKWAHAQFLEELV